MLFHNECLFRLIKHILFNNVHTDEKIKGVINKLEKEYKLMFFNPCELFGISFVLVT